jgi:glycosyltransferase involved in cell wall biosynthesis
MIKVAFLTTTVSPFWFDFAKAAYKLGINFKLFFSQSAVSDGRPSHWDTWSSTNSEFESFAALAPAGISKTELASWYLQMLIEWEPNVVIASTYKPWVMKPAETYTKRIIPLGLWAEKPLPISFLLKPAKEFIIKSQMKNVDFCLAIGDRAEKVYRRLISNKDNVFILPYSQNLTDFITKTYIYRDELRVLFSGQLIKRHNIKMIAEAIEYIYNNETYFSKISYIFSGSGPEKVHLDRLKKRYPELDPLIEIIDKPFEKWEDRINPYKEADVLLYPSRYSGWGLVVPEALAAGLPVISTRQVEAARYYIEHGVNGFFIEQSTMAIVQSLRTFCNNPKLISMFSSNAKESSRKGFSDHVAKDFLNILTYILK